MSLLAFGALMLCSIACEKQIPIQVKLRTELQLPGSYDYDDGLHVRSIHVVDDNIVVIEKGTADSTIVLGIRVKEGDIAWSFDLSDHVRLEKKRSRSQRVLGASICESEYVFIVEAKLLDSVALYWNPDSRQSRVRRLGPCSLELSRDQEHVPIIDCKAIITGLSEPRLVDLTGETQDLPLDAHGHGSPVTFVSLSPNLNYAACTTYQPEVWDLRSSKRVQRYVPPQSVIDSWKPAAPGYRPTSCAISPDNKLIAVGTSQGQLLLFDLLSAKLIHWDSIDKLYDGKKLKAHYMRFLPDSRFVFVSWPLCIFDCETKTWVPPEALSQILDWLGPTPMMDVRGTMLAVVHRDDGKLRVYDLAPGE